MAHDELQVVIYWRGTRRFEWQVTDGDVLVDRGEQPTLALARVTAFANVTIIRARRMLGIIER